jgi:DNA-binding transcriptional regulator YiaG
VSALSAQDIERERIRSSSAAEAVLGRPDAAQRAEKPLPPTLRDLRHESGLKLTQAAERMGFNKARLSELERGLRGPSHHELEHLSRFYGVALCVRLAIVVDEAGA